MVKTKRLKGFSLFELLTIIAVILVLIITSFIFIPKQIIKAKDAKTKTNLHQIYMALEDYYDSNNEFPRSLPDCNQPLVKDGHVYIANIPCDPFDNSNYGYTTSRGDSGNWFRVYANLRNKEDQIISLVGCNGGCGPDCQYNYGLSSSNTLLKRCSYVCAPGGGKTGECLKFDDASLSKCPKLYGNDPTCKNECSVAANRCENSSGKQKPE